MISLEVEGVALMDSLGVFSRMCCTYGLTGFFFSIVGVALMDSLGVFS